MKELVYPMLIEASELIVRTGYYGVVPPEDLEGMELYGFRHETTEELVAVVGIIRQGAQAYLDYLSVDGAHRDVGVASTLLDLVRAELKEQGVRVVHACVSGENGAAVKMLTKHNARIGWPYVNALITLEDSHGE